MKLVFHSFVISGKNVVKIQNLAAASFCLDWIIYDSSEIKNDVRQSVITRAGVYILKSKRLRRGAASSLCWTNAICTAVQPWAAYYTEWKGCFWLHFWKKLHQILGWWSKKGMAYTVQKCASPMYSQLQPSPPRWAATRTWLRLEAQFWASSAWALSVSCLSVLLSTVTLPSPICLMNRRNYTTTGKNDSKTAFAITKCHVSTNALLFCFQSREIFFFK